MTLRIFESFFYKSLIRACSFDNSLAASQNARSYVQTIDHRALRICKKRIQKVLMLSPFFLINISSYLLSDSYNETLFKPLHSMYVKRYWLMIFVFVDRRWKKLTNTDLSRCLENIQIAYLQFVDNIIGVESSAILYWYIITSTIIIK